MEQHWDLVIVGGGIGGGAVASAMSRAGVSRSHRTSARSRIGPAARRDGHSSLDGLWMPLLNIYMNRRIESEERATTLSLMNVVSRLALAAALTLIGLVVAEAGLTATLLSSAIAAAAAGALLVAPSPRLRSAGRRR